MWVRALAMVAVLGAAVLGAPGTGSAAESSGELIDAVGCYHVAPQTTRLTSYPTGSRIVASVHGRQTLLQCGPDGRWHPVYIRGEVSTPPGASQPTDVLP